MHLLEDFVDVDGVRLPPPPFPLLVGPTGGLSLGGGLLAAFRSYGWSFSWHGYSLSECISARFRPYL